MNLRRLLSVALAGAALTALFFSVQATAQAQNQSLSHQTPAASSTITIKVTYPDVNVTWEKGKSYTVRWASRGVAGNVKIRLVNANGQALDLAGNLPNNGMRDCLVPANLPDGAYRVQVLKVDGSVRGESSGTVTIGAAKTLSAPVTPQAQEGKIAAAGAALTPGSPKLSTAQASQMPVTKLLDLDEDGISDSEEARLLAKFRPYLRFTKDHGTDEEYRPTDVLFYLHRSKVIESGDEGSKTILDNSVLRTHPDTILNLIWKDFHSSDYRRHPQQTKYHINPLEHPPGLEGGNVARHGNPWTEVEARRNVGLYGHVTPFQGPNGLLYKVEYWQFFGYNNTAESLDLGDHEGDWTTVQVTVDPAQNDKIISVLHSAHGLDFLYEMSATTKVLILRPDPVIKDGTVQEYHGHFLESVDLVSHDLKFRAKEGELQKAQNNILRLYHASGETGFTHPVVYVEYGTHEFYPSQHWDYYAAPKHTGDSPHSYLTSTPPNLGEVGHPLKETAAASIILHYNGYWGAYSRKNAPPPGPVLHQSKWTQPVVR